MERVITVLAAPPQNMEGKDVVIEAIKAKIDCANRSGRIKHTVLSAWSIEYLAYLLEQDKQSGHPPPSMIQIIGHGSSGMLSLGQHWTKRYKQRVGESIRHYVLDSDPRVYNALRNRVAPSTEVWLVGCSVGDDATRSVDSLALGPTLLFDLSQMWGCPVAAPASLVAAEDFNNDGLYSHPKRMMRVEGLTISSPTERPLAPTPSSASPELEFKRIVSAPILDFGQPASARRTAHLDPQVGATLATIFRHKATVQPQLAMAELRVWQKIK
jgi:hypothetical protein